MHIDTNMGKSLIGSLLNVPRKTKYGLKFRMDLKRLWLKSKLVVEIVHSCKILLAKSCTLTRDKKEMFMETRNDLQFPQGYCSIFYSLVSRRESKLVGLKSHDYHRLMQWFLTIAI